MSYHSPAHFCYLPTRVFTQFDHYYEKYKTLLFNMIHLEMHFVDSVHSLDQNFLRMGP